jgi:hypothetical protein
MGSWSYASLYWKNGEKSRDVTLKLKAAIRDHQKRKLEKSEQAPCVSKVANPNKRS